MSPEILTKTFHNKPIYFEVIGNDTFLNATKTAQQFKTSKGNSRDLNEWLNSKATKEYIQALKNSDTEKFGNTSLFKVAKGNFSDDRVQGTWLHPKLTIFFARWLSPEFAVWCDVQIEEIIKGKTVAIQTTNENIISVSDSELDRELKTLKFILDNFNLSEKEKIEKSNEVFQNINFIVKLENPHLKKREAVFTLTQLLAEFGISISTKDFNLKLESFGIIERFGSGWILLEMKFGENRETQNGKNHRYYKSSFQELLDIVL